MADLVTRLLLDAKQFDNNIKQSKDQLKLFKDQGTNVASQGTQGLIGSLGKMKGVLTKLTPAVLAGIAAFEGYKTIISANATKSEEFDTKLEACKQTTEQFFRSLTNGDWTVFKDGIDDAIEHSKDFIREYKKLRKTLLVHSIKYEQTDAEKDRLESIIENKNLPLSMRKDAQVELDTMLIKGIADNREALEQANRSLVTQIKSIVGNTNYNNLNPENIQKFILDYYDENSSKRKKLDEYRNARKAGWAGTASSYAMGDAGKYGEYNDLKAIYDSYSVQERAVMDETLRIVDALSEEVFNQFDETFSTINDLKAKSAAWEKDRSGARDTMFDAVKEDKSSGGKITPKEVIPVGSIKEAQKVVTDLLEAYLNATSNLSRTQIRFKLDKAEKQLEDLKREVKIEPLEIPVKIEIAKVDDKGFINKKVKEDIDSGAIKVEAPAIDNSASIQSNFDLVDSLTMVNSALGSISGTTQEGAAAWLTYTANIISGVAAMLPSLASLFGVESALGIAEQSKIPFPMNVIAMAATGAALIAAIASVPKFADGGIFESPLTTGDRNFARLNGGEMILNKGQQSNLFKLLDHGGSISGQPAEVTVRIKGKDLVGVLNNHQNKVSKYV